MSDRAGQRILIAAAVLLTLLLAFGAAWMVLDGPRKNEAYLAVKAHVESTYRDAKVIRPTRITTADYGDDPRRVFVSVDLTIAGKLHRDVKIVAARRDDGSWGFISPASLDAVPMLAEH